MTTTPQKDTAAEMVALDRVRRRVAALGFFVVIAHAVIGLAWAGLHMDTLGRRADGTMLLVLSYVAAVGQYLGVRAILGKPFWSPLWILASAVPTTIFVILR